MRSVPVELWYIVVLAIWGAVYVRPEMRRRRARERLRRIAEATGGILPPLTVRYEEEREVHPWCEARAREFEAIGFVRLGAYRQVGSTRRIVSLAAEGGTLLASAVHGDVLGPTRQVFARLADGRIVCANDRRREPGAMTAPWWTLVHAPGASAARLTEVLRAQISGERLLPTAWPDLFAESVAEERRVAEWALVHGGYTLATVQAIGEITGLTADPESLAFLRAAHAPGDVYPHP